MLERLTRRELITLGLTLTGLTVGTVLIAREVESESVNPPLSTKRLRSKSSQEINQGFNDLVGLRDQTIVIEPTEPRGKEQLIWETGQAEPVLLNGKNYFKLTIAPVLRGYSAEWHILLSKDQYQEYSKTSWGLTPTINYKGFPSVKLPNGTKFIGDFVGFEGKGIFSLKRVILPQPSNP